MHGCPRRSARAGIRHFLARRFHVLDVGDRHAGRASTIARGAFSRYPGRWACRVASMIGRAATRHSPADVVCSRRIRIDMPTLRIGAPHVVRRRISVARIGVADVAVRVARACRERRCRRRVDASDDGALRRSAPRSGVSKFAHFRAIGLVRREIRAAIAHPPTCGFRRDPDASRRRVDTRANTSRMRALRCMRVRKPRKKRCFGKSGAHRDDVVPKIVAGVRMCATHLVVVVAASVPGMFFRRGC